MLIDWFTVGAQVLNFLILVGLLRRYLYQPILNAIAARETLIAHELAEAAKNKGDAQKERDDFKRKNDEFDQKRTGLLNKAETDAATERLRLMGVAREESDALNAKRQQGRLKEAASLNQSISRRVQQEVFSISRQALTELASATLEARVGEVFTRRLRDMDAGAKSDFADALRTATGPALIRSAFELPPDERASIQKTINETFSRQVDLRFETNPEVICGIELFANGRKIGWNIENYLKAMSNRIDELLSKPASSAATEPHVNPVADRP